MMKKTIVKLKGVPETMLIPLRARYLESKRLKGIISDPKTIEILDQIECDFSGEKEVSIGSQLGVSIRTEILDEQVTKFMTAHPNATVINLGCGLDTRFYRIDNGSVTWRDLDVSCVIELRKNFFVETDRFKFIAKSVTDYSWLENLPKSKPFLFIAEGLLMYFEENDVKEILYKIGTTHPESEMLLEAMSPFMAKKTEKHQDVKKYNAKFKWGLKTGRDLEKWDQGINFIGEWYFFDRHKNRHPFLFKLLSIIPAFRKGLKIIHINFSKNGT